MAIACAVVAFAGFAPTYWVPLAAGTFAGRPVMHIHGLIFSAWTLFFVYQTWLVARERSVRHRAVGLAGISLATGMVILGVLASISQMKGAEAQGLLPAGKAFAIVPLAVVEMYSSYLFDDPASIGKEFSTSCSCRCSDIHFIECTCFGAALSI